MKNLRAKMFKKQTIFIQYTCIVPEPFADFITLSLVLTMTQVLMPEHQTHVKDDM